MTFILNNNNNNYVSDVLFSHNSQTWSTTNQWRYDIVYRNMRFSLQWGA